MIVVMSGEVGCLFLLGEIVVGVFWLRTMCCKFMSMSSMRSSLWFVIEECQRF